MSIIIKMNAPRETRSFGERFVFMAFQKSLISKEFKKETI